MLEKLVVAVFAELSLSLHIVFSARDWRIFWNIGHTPATDTAFHLSPAATTRWKTPAVLFAYIDIVCHIQPHFSIGVGTGEGVAISSRLQNTVTRVLPPLVQV